MGDAGWELVFRNASESVARFKVPGGWLYRNVFDVADGTAAVKSVFVPDAMTVSVMDGPI